MFTRANPGDIYREYRNMDSPDFEPDLEILNEPMITFQARFRCAFSIMQNRLCIYYALFVFKLKIVCGRFAVSDDQWG